ncbi:ribonuclease domain-containing protein [Streptomyces sp. NPDC088387]|uniref:ribonuclease domain-containing protein n=1 Tax=Streptomyces sp. NPDC088387 TaxID=3365859 RepID=UPI00381BBD24
MLLRWVLRMLACAVLVLVAGCATTDAADVTETAGAASGPATPSWARDTATVPVADLPAEARETLRLIDAGGPFPYAKDGAVFGNLEGLLPARDRGYYHEYTVPTPGSRDRGARRIVTGDGGEIYYTDDHYESFRAVLR